MASSVLSLKRAIPASKAYFRELWNRREFAVYLALGNLKARNASTALGLLWWVLNPLLLGAIYALVFGGILGFSRGTNYIAYLLSGIFPFYYTRSAMVGGVLSITANSRMVANLKFPRLILPLSALFESFIGFLASLVVFFLIVGPIEGVWPGLNLLWLIPTVAIHTVFNFGLATVTARIAVPFRDVNNLVPYLVRLWLYLSPILYPADFLSRLTPAMQGVLEANPLFSILALYRRALTGAPATAGDLLTATIWAVGIAVVGTALFVKYEGKMARYL